MTALINAIVGGLSNLINPPQQVQIPGGGVVDPHNQIVAQENRYAQLGEPNSTGLTQDIAGLTNAASQATFTNQLQLAQLAMQANQQGTAGLAQQGQAAAGNQTSGQFDQPTTTSTSDSGGNPAG
jgi:hypothetical protein